MIQIALVGKSPIVVEEGLKKFMPTKVYILHTKDDAEYKFEEEAKKLKLTIESRYNINTSLLEVNAFEMNQIIKTILSTILKERNKSELRKNDFVINITGGTKLMVAAASTAAYLAGARVIYVMDPSKYRGEDLVKELPMPIRPENDNLGNTSKTTALVLEKINKLVKKLGKCNNRMLLTEIQKDPKSRSIKRIEYTLNILENNNLITRTAGWETSKKNNKTGKNIINRKLKTIRLTPTGEFYAEYPGLMGSIV